MMEINLSVTLCSQEGIIQDRVKGGSFCLKEVLMDAPSTSINMFQSSVCEENYHYFDVRGSILITKLINVLEDFP